MKEIKTNVLRILEKQGVAHTCTVYDTKDGKIDGVSVAQKVGKDPREVYKTLVLKGKSGQCYVCVVPVEKEVNFKKASQATKEKNIEMLHLNDLLKTTGYMRGGCSPIGMKKAFPTIIDESAATLVQMTVSAGRVGMQVTLAPADLVQVTGASYAAIVD